MAKLVSNPDVVTVELSDAANPDALPLSCTKDMPNVRFDYKPYVKEIYSCTIKRLRAADIDQEVKELSLIHI